MIERARAEQRAAAAHIASQGPSRASVLWLSDWALEEVLIKEGSNEMTLVVYLHRRGKFEARCGTLSAHVVQEGRYGVNLLRGRQLTNVASAKREVQRQLSGHQLIWQGEGEPKPSL